MMENKNTAEVVAKMRLLELKKKIVAKSNINKKENLCDFLLSKLFSEEDRRDE